MCRRLLVWCVSCVCLSRWCVFVDWSCCWCLAALLCLGVTGTPLFDGTGFFVWLLCWYHSPHHEHPPSRVPSGLRKYLPAVSGHTNRSTNRPEPVLNGLNQRLRRDWFRVPRWADAPIRGRVYTGDGVSSRRMRDLKYVPSTCWLLYSMSPLSRHLPRSASVTSCSRFRVDLRSADNSCVQLMSAARLSLVACNAAVS